MPLISLGKPLFGTSNQRAKRLAKPTADDIALAKAREEHLAMTMDTLTHSPSTVETTQLGTPPMGSSKFAQGYFPKPAAATGTKTGLGLGFIGTQPIQDPSTSENVTTSLPATPTPSSPGNWRFTLSTRAATPNPPSRSASFHLGVEPSARFEKRLSLSSKAESRLPSSGAQSSMIDSYYYGSQSGRAGPSERAQSGKGSKAPSRLGMNHDTRRSSMPMDEASPFAFEAPPLPESPFIPFDFTKSPSVSRRSSPTSPHKIKRKPVPSVEEWTLAVEESTRITFDLPSESQTASRPPRQQRVYMNQRGAMSTPMFAKSTPAFTMMPVRPPTESTPPLPTTKSANAKSSLIESFKSFAANYKSRAFGRRNDGEDSSTSISTGESTGPQTPRESYEDFIQVPGNKQERKLGLKPVQRTAPKIGYTTRAQREAARAEEEVEGKKIGRFAKLFAIQ
jgi:hypothetical protein